MPPLKKGKVILVGAGPGHAGLLTMAGYLQLKKADVAVVDALVSRDLLKNIRARIFFVGKRGPGAPLGRSHEWAQEKINRLLINLANKGKRVVRLKGGDPFLFGRGREELEALRTAKISTEVIPGLSSATAVPAWVGISITDRRISSQVTILTGHEGRKKRSGSPGVDWKSLSPKGTLVILMGVSEWPQIRRRLLANRWPKGVPVAAIESGTTPNERTLESTLEDSVRFFQAHRLVAPAVIVVGEVVRLRRSSTPFDPARSLGGKRVVVTRPLAQNAELVSLLDKNGAEVVVAPVIKILPLQRNHQIDHVVKMLRARSVSYDGVLFLSVNAAPSLAKALGTAKQYLNAVPKVAIGPQSAKSVCQQGWPLVRYPSRYNSQGVLKSLGNVRGKRFLVPRVSNAPPDFVRALLKKGAHVDEVETYRTVPVRLLRSVRKELIAGVDAVVFTSSSTVKNFLKSFNAAEKKTIFSRAIALSVGPQTTQTLRRNNIPWIVETANATPEEILRSLIDSSPSI